MKRKIYSKLLDWKQRRKGEVAILIDGPRRVGKSYIAQTFGQNEYKSYILIDFSDDDPQVRQIFDNYLNDLDMLFSSLQLHYHTTLYKRESLIIFDEIQFYPKARAAIKRLVADRRYDYIETGSLVSINKNVKDIVIPSEEKRISMFPMDFEEFLWALGDEMTMPFVRQCFEKHQPLGPLHRKTMDVFRQYLIVGGMPQAILKFVETKNFSEADEQKRKIIALYRADIQKHASGYESKVTQIFDTLPGELQKHEKKFRLSSLKSEARFRDYESSFLWLDDAKVINTCFGATEPSVGLKMKLDNLALKLYMADTGLLISHAFDENTITDENLYQKLLLDKLEINQGMLVENIVAQMLRANGHKLYFYSSYSLENSEDRMEVDFLIAKQNLTNRHNISPIEVKSSANYTLSSLNKFIRKFGEQLATPYVVHPKDYEEKNGIVFLPYYMVPLL